MAGRPVADSEIVPAFVSGTDDPDVALDLNPGSSAPAVFTDTHMTEDPYYVPAWTKALESVRDSLLGGTSAAVRNVEAPAGPSEFSFGKGGMAPLSLADPSLAQQLQAVYRTDPADPEAPLDYSDRVGEPDSFPSI